MSDKEKFTATFSECEEIMCTISHEGITYEINPLGTWLIEILNTNMKKVESLLRHFPVEHETDAEMLAMGYSCSFVPPSSEEYNSMISHHRFLKAYSLYMWPDLYFEVIPEGGEHCLCDVICNIKCFIELTGVHPEYMDYLFLRRYVFGNILPSDCLFDFQEYSPDAVFSDDERDELLKEKLDRQMDIAFQKYSVNDKIAPVRYKYSFPEGYSKNRIEGIVFSSLFEVARSGKVVKKCKNCGKYFIPANRSDTLYCNNPSPADPTKTCKEYGSQRLWYNRQKDDELATLSRNILSAKGMLAKRNKDIPAYQESYDYFRKERIRWKKAVQVGEKTREEYYEWLLSMKNKKTMNGAKE